MFEQFGDIGHLCDGVPEICRVLHEIMHDMNEARYAGQVEALRRTCESRRPGALARQYRAVVSEHFGGLGP